MSSHLSTGLAWQLPRAARRRRAAAQGLSAAIGHAWRRWRTRRMVVELDDRMLKDIGASRSDARAEASKPFWRV